MNGGTSSTPSARPKEIHEVFVQESPAKSQGPSLRQVPWGLGLLIVVLAGGGVSLALVLYGSTPPRAVAVREAPPPWVPTYSMAHTGEEGRLSLRDGTGPVPVFISEAA